MSRSGLATTGVRTALSLNTGQLACFAEDDDRVSDRHGRLGPAAMVGTFELVAAHLAFHRTRVGTQPPLGDPLSNDLGDRPPDRPGDLVRGKTPRGWPGDDARSAACPQTTAGRGPSPRPARPPPPTAHGRARPARPRAPAWGQGWWSKAGRSRPWPGAGRGRRWRTRPPEPRPGRACAGRWPHTAATATTRRKGPGPPAAWGRSCRSWRATTAPRRSRPRCATAWRRQTTGRPTAAPPPNPPAPPRPAADRPASSPRWHTTPSPP